MTAPTPYPENPVVGLVWRGAYVESIHRGSWVLVDRAGSVLAGAGHHHEPYFARSAVKCLQALPLIETGAADRFGLTPEELTLAVASHNAEACHTDGVRRVLERIGRSPADLLCGSQPPGDPEARKALLLAGEKPSALHNNCSGKHAGFLVLAKHLGIPPERYLDPESDGQVLVRNAILEMGDLPCSAMTQAVDGCSAPTFRIPLRGLATAFARVANPEELASERRAACLRITEAVAAHPHLIAGNHNRFCTALGRATGGRVFPKVGAEAIYAVGVRGADRGLAVKVDDGSYRGLYAIVLALLARFDLITSAELEKLRSWDGSVLKNWAGLEVGHIEVVA